MAWKKMADNVAMVLTAVGGINWGLVGLANFNLVESLFGTAVFTKIVYIAVGASAIWLIVKGIKK